MKKRIWKSLVGQWVRAWFTGIGPIEGAVYLVDELHQTFAMEDADGRTWAVSSKMRWERIK